MARYDIPVAQYRVEQVIDRSRFICTVAPAGSVEEAQAFVKRMNAEFADATHNCWAYVIGPPGSTDRVGISDDGEPHGTAGRPMLTVLLHSGVGDVVAVVTRYYGGTKLGTGGLVKAYGGAVQLAVEGMERAPRVDWVGLEIVVSYASIGALQQIWPACEVDVLEEIYEADARFRVRVPEERVGELRAAVMDATRGQGVVREV
ncbi:MAG: YigZ family protein [Gemmatimonadota bacterium]